VSPATQKNTGKPAGAKKPAAPRDRAATEERLLAAVGIVLAREGFKALGVGSVAREAGVDKVLIYRYFGGLPELLEAWGASGRFWPRVQDLLEHEGEGFLERPTRERWARFLEHFIDELRRRPLTLAVLAAEVEERNELTAILETEREEWGHEAGRILGGPAFAEAEHLRVITVLLVAGIQYLALRARRVRIFGGIDIQADAGWDELKAAIRALAERVIPADLG
jgi:AcrR family transcriptional regulator